MQESPSALSRGQKADWDKFKNTQELRSLVWATRCAKGEDPAEESISFVDDALRKELVDNKWIAPGLEVTIALSQSFENHERLAKKARLESAISEAKLQGAIDQMNKTLGSGALSASSGSSSQNNGGNAGNLTAPDQKILDLSTKHHIPKLVVEAISKGKFTFAHASRPSHALVQKTNSITVSDGVSNLAVSQRSRGKQCLSFQDYAQCLYPVTAIREEYNVSTREADARHMAFMRDVAFVNMSILGANAVDVLIRSTASAYKDHWSPIHPDALARMAVMSAKWISHGVLCNRCGYLGHEADVCPLQSAVEEIKAPAQRVQFVIDGKGAGKGGDRSNKGQQQMLCHSFITRGRSCTYQKNCRRVHFCPSCQQSKKHKAGCAKA